MRDPIEPEELAMLAYNELKELARREMGRERVNHTLQPTALVHEAYLRLIGEGVQFETRGHFFAAAASAIRRVLVEHARRRARLKRGGDRNRLEMVHEEMAEPVRDDRILALDEALNGLAAFDPDKARLVELRFFAGMTVADVAEVLGVSESTVARDWRLARAWLLDVLGEI